MKGGYILLNSFNMAVVVKGSKHLLFFIILFLTCFILTKDFKSTSKALLKIAIVFFLFNLL